MIRNTPTDQPTSLAASTEPKMLLDHKMRCDPTTLRWNSLQNYDPDRRADRSFQNVVGPNSRAASGDCPWKGLGDLYTLAQTGSGSCLVEKTQPDDGTRPAMLSKGPIPLELRGKGMYDGAEPADIIEGQTKDSDIARVRCLNNQSHSQMALVRQAVSCPKESRNPYTNPCIVRQRSQIGHQVQRLGYHAPSSTFPRALT